MRHPAYITTSWDDGHPLDGRVAELLTRHGLRGTFYIPRSCEYGTMSAAQVRELGQTFEVGAHTLGHVELTAAPDAEAEREIAGSKAWVEDTTDRPCSLFCAPKGKFAARHLAMIRRAGYACLRTVELLSTAAPRPTAGLLVMPTTVQAYPHGPGAYARNAVRRRAVGNLWRFLLHGRTADWLKVLRALVDRVLRRGGVLHLWGHSWEIEATGQWGRLDEALRLLGDAARQAPALTNGQVCEQVGAVGSEAAVGGSSR